MLIQGHTTGPYVHSGTEYMHMMPTFSEKDNKVDLKKYQYIVFCWLDGMFLMAHLTVLSFQGQATKQTKDWP